MELPERQLAAERNGWWRAARPAAEVALIFLVFFVHAGWPVPASNESHYLGKAKHYWEPAWCARDFFLNTADAHQVFYWTFGWLSLWLPLPAMAWCGRLITWALLAVAWRSLSAAVVPGTLYAVLSAGLFVACNDRLYMAGEWVVGGIEAKGFAYALVFLAFAFLARGRWSLAWLLLGAASSFHVLVGGWSVVCAGIAWLTSPGDRPRLFSMVPSLIGGGLLSLPGLLPALLLTWNVPKDIVNQANVIYVFERLPHHLVPQTFGSNFLARHAALVVGWMLLCIVVPTRAEDRILRRLVFAAIGIAVVGFAISLLADYDQQIAAGLLRYYWFRMSDALVPVGVALLGVRLVDLRTRQPSRHAMALAAVSVLVALHLGGMVVRRQRVMRPPADNQIVDLADWRATCGWARQHTSPNALFLSPRLAQTFRWYAHRAEVVNRKDVPQDARGIVEWQRRLHDVYLGRTAEGFPIWHDNLAEIGTQRVVALGQKYEADYIITEAQPPLALKLVNPAGTRYAIYRIPQARKPSAATTARGTTP